MSINPDTGEVVEDGDGCERCKVLQAQIDGVEMEIRAWRLRYHNLKKDQESEAESSPHWDECKALFDFWRRKCNHERSRFSAERFFLVEPFLLRDGVQLCKKAIEGAAFDPFTKVRRNGSVQRFDGWELIFRNRAKFEEFCNRAPR